MTFNSITFAFIFLPASLLLYYIVPRRIKSFVLVLLSLLFYAWGDIRYLLLLLFSMAFNYLAALEIYGWRNRGFEEKTKAGVISAVAVNLALLGFYKYMGFLLGIVGIRYQAPPLPIGISFYTFTVLSYVLDVYFGKASCERNIISYMLYVSFFPKITQGPIVEYHKIKEQLAEREISVPGLCSGMRLFLVGMFKKVLIADNLGAAFASLQGVGKMASATAWLGMIFYSLQLYFDFSGYSDMAIGLGRMFGFRLEKNFDYPYMADSVSDFWRRWHISLGAWFRDYVYIPLGGNRCSQARQIMNLSVVWLLTGIWHGASWNFIVWGIYHGLWVIGDKVFFSKFMNRVPRLFRIIGTTLIAFFGWIFFFTPTLGAAFGWMGQMFGSARLGFWNATTSYYLGSNAILLILAFLCCGPNVSRVVNAYSYEKSKVHAGISVACYLLLFILCISNMIANSYSSFLYVRF